MGVDAWTQLPPSSQIRKVGSTMNPEWLQCFVEVKHSDFEKETPKSYCFKLWGKKRQVFPKQFVKNYDFNGITHRFTMPKWFIEKNRIQSLMDADQREAVFPKKKAEQPLLEQLRGKEFSKVEIVESEKGIESITTQPSLLPDWMQ